ncbi:calcineurin subunit B [Hyaloraphidium curvatum]|nr:calcineurin subunit B [Hyaloraphidium curvatum]
MGASSSTLSDEEVNELSANTAFSPDQITRLYRRFREIDKDNSATITPDELFQIPELSLNPLAPRIIEVFSEDGRNELDFREFVTCLSVFARDVKREVKLQFAFRVYDVQSDGFIDFDELFSIMKMMVGTSLTDDQIREIVDKTILEADCLDRDGTISWEEFKRALSLSDVEGLLTIDF